MNSKAIRKQLLAAVAMVLVAAVALGSSTYAWFVSNNTVQANVIGVSAASANGNLYIVKGLDASGGKTTDSFSFSGQALYPISTKACDKWYVVTNWANNKANTYAQVQLTDNTTDGAGTYTYIYPNTNNKITRNAYTVATFTIYTDAGEQDVYFDGKDAITVTGAANDLDKSLRIGIFADNTLVAVYAPYAETAVGNSNDTTSVTQSAGSYYAITDSGLTLLKKTATPAADDDIFVSDLTGNKYVATTDNSGIVTAGTAKLFTANSTGKQVRIVMWLEGTDGECTTEKVADTKDDTFKVSIDFTSIIAPASQST